MVESAGRLAAVVMASGFSRRMGRNKLLLPVGDGTVVGHVLDQVDRMGYRPVVVVSQYDEVLALARERGFYAVMNPTAVEGKSSSIRLGTAALEALASEAGAAGIAFFMGDQVLLTDTLLTELNEAFLQSRTGVVFPTYDGMPGSPGIFPWDMRGRLLALTGEDGGMKAAKEQPDRIIYVAAEPGWQGMDIDTEEAYALVRERLGVAQ